MRPVDQPVPRARVVVTGGTRGIGAGIARAFLRAGAQVLVCGRTEPAALPAADGRAAAFAQADVRDPEQARTLIATAQERFGGGDGAGGNAGRSPPAPPAPPPPPGPPHITPP